ncbi:MAG TPA: hypothetical protein VFJ58_27235 [Armatimonadota bacterium]|nr:hypothetical protein [Armatimonadota bacterium]
MLARLRREAAAREAAEEKWRAKQERQRLARAAEAEAARVKVAESLLEKRPLLAILIKEGRPALIQNLQAEPQVAGESNEPVSVESRADAVLDTLLRAQHDINLRGPDGFPTGPDAYLPSFGRGEPPGGRAAWFDLLDYLEPIIRRAQNAQSRHLVALSTSEGALVSEQPAPEPAPPPGLSDQQTEAPAESPAKPLTEYQLHEIERGKLQEQIRIARMNRYIDNTPDPPQLFPNWSQYRPRRW